MRQLTPVNVLRAYVGVREVAGSGDNPHIVSFIATCRPHAEADDISDQTAWCSAAVNAACFVAGYETTNSLRARSWLRIGTPVAQVKDAEEGDIVILGRGRKPYPGPNVVAAPGHVGFLANKPHLPTPRSRPTSVSILGGNQGDAVSIKTFHVERIVGIRRPMPIDGRASEPVQAQAQPKASAVDLQAAHNHIIAARAACETAAVIVNRIIKGDA